MVPIPTDVPALQVPGARVHGHRGDIHPPQEDGVCVILGFSVMAHNLLEPGANSAASSSDWWALGGCGHDRTYPKLHGSLTNHSHRAPPSPLLFFVPSRSSSHILYFSGFPSINTTLIKEIKMPVDLLNPTVEAEASTHKLKRLVQTPNSFFMDIKCPGCFQITTVFSHAQTVVLCGSCNVMLCQPTGGKARLTEGCSYRRKVD
jgi:small subunit ribosomal protein S27e